MGGLLPTLARSKRNDRRSLEDTGRFVNCELLSWESRLRLGPAPARCGYWDEDRSQDDKRGAEADEAGLHWFLLSG
jgi:hypothetical protein